MKQRSTLLLTVVAFGYAFLYVPIVSVIVYSFNDSRLVTLWGGFSLRWYRSLLESEDILASAMLSLQIALVSATLATILGTLAGLALNRLESFKGRTLLTGMVTAPLVMPEIITGISLLFLFISMAEWVGWPTARGAVTITIAHVTFSLAYVAVIVRSRLSGMDQSLEEAAMDLGGRPLRVFFDITVPSIAPAMISGWLLAFTLSLDDVVISSFVSGPGATTLPMLIFSKVKLGVTPDINALATVIILLVSTAVVTLRKGFQFPEIGARGDSAGAGGLRRENATGRSCRSKGRARRPGPDQRRHLYRGPGTLAGRGRRCPGRRLCHGRH